MSLHEYRQAVELHRSGVDFYALIMAAAMGADSLNLERLRAVFPSHVEEASNRWNSPGGVLRGEPSYDEIMAARG